VQKVEVVVDKDIDISSYASAVDCREILKQLGKKTKSSVQEKSTEAKETLPKK